MMAKTPLVVGDVSINLEQSWKYMLFEQIGIKAVGHQKSGNNLVRGVPLKKLKHTLHHTVHPKSEIIENKLGSL